MKKHMIVINIGGTCFLAESLKKASAVIQAMHDAELRPFNRSYTKNPKGDDYSVRYVFANDEEISVELRVPFEIDEPQAKEAEKETDESLLVYLPDDEPAADSQDISNDQ